MCNVLVFWHPKTWGRGGGSKKDTVAHPHPKRWEQMLPVPPVATPMCWSYCVSYLWLCADGFASVGCVLIRLRQLFVCLSDCVSCLCAGKIVSVACVLIKLRQLLVCWLGIFSCLYADQFASVSCVLFRLRHLHLLIRLRHCRAISGRKTTFRSFSTFGIQGWRIRALVFT